MGVQEKFVIWLQMGSLKLVGDDHWQWYWEVRKVESDSFRERAHTQNADDISARRDGGMAGWRDDQCYE